MDPTRHECPAFLARHPPHRPVTPVFEQCVTRLGESLLIAAATDIVDHCLWHYLVAVEPTAVTQHLAKTRQIPQPRIQATTGERRADGVHCEIAVLLGTQPAPDVLRQQLRNIAAGGAGNDPAQHVGVDGFVGKRFAVLALRLHRLQKLVVTARSLITLGFGQRVACPGMGPDLGIRVRVVLAVFEARRHVEHLPYRGAAKRRIRQFRYIFGNPLVSIDAPLRHQHGTQRADQGLGH
ncbi:hypothetical protein D3C78_1093610 [compost metagenome]